MSFSLMILAQRSKHVPDAAAANSTLATAREPSRRDRLPYQVRHLDEIDWETIRWPGETGQDAVPSQPRAANRAQCRHPAARARARIIPNTITASSRSG